MDLKEIVSSNVFSLPEIINITSDILERIIKVNVFTGKKSSENFQTFNSEYLLKTVSLNEYLSRICYYAKLSTDMMIIALFYLDLFCKKNTDFSLNEINCHKLIFSSIVITIKFYDDYTISNKTFCLIGGVSVEELSKMESLFYKKIDFCLLFQEKVYNEYIKKLIIFQNMKNRVK